MSDIEDRVRRAIREEVRRGIHGASPASWDDVVARSERNVRRPFPLRSAAALAVAALIVISAVKTMDSGRSSTSDLSSPGEVKPFPDYCATAGQSDGALSEVSNDLRYLPTWLPRGETIRRSYEANSPRCAPLDRAGAALLAQSYDEDGIVEAVVRVYGPFSASPYPPDPNVNHGRSYTRLRETTAHIAITGGSVPEVTVTWTEPDETAWIVHGLGLDDQAVLDVAESLDIDSTAERAKDMVRLRQDELRNFDVAWPDSSRLPPDRHEWVVESDGCELRFEETPRAAAPRAVVPEPGDEAVPMDGGREALLDPVGTLRWAVNDEVMGSANCGAEDESAADDVLRVADSVVWAPASDYRLEGD